MYTINEYDRKLLLNLIRNNQQQNGISENDRSNYYYH